MPNLPQATLWPLRPPWPHQAIAFSTCVAVLSRPSGRGLVVFPTGTGKTRLIRALVYWLVGGRRRVIVAAPTEEILDQLSTDFRRETRTPFYLDKGLSRASVAPLLTLASHQTLWRRLDRHEPSAVLLFDEAHHSGLPAARNLSTLRRFHHVIGFTASPWSPECETIYRKEVLYQYPLTQAIAEGYLCRYRLAPFPERVPPPGRFELYFCESNETARLFTQAYPSAAYLGHDSKDRDQVVSAFRTGTIRRIYTNRMLTEGFDCPDVGTIYIDKVSGSDILNYQMVGRGLRRKKEGGDLLVYSREPGVILQALGRAG